MKKERYYCFPDIHGCSGVLKQALTHVYKENPEGGKVIFLGDYIDRGPDNLGVLKIVMNPPSKWEFICLMGNHEKMFIDSYYRRSEFYDASAAKDIAGLGRNEFAMYEQLYCGIDKSIIQWMDNLDLFHIEDKNVFAHAYYDDTLSPVNQNPSVCIWDRLTDSEKYWNDNQGLYLTHGHTPRKNAPVKAQNRVNLDAGAVFYGRYVIAEYHKNVQGPVAFYEFSV